MAIIFKNGGINLSKLSEFMGYSPQKLRTHLSKIKTSKTDEVREENQKQYDALVLGGLAMYAGLTKKDIISIIRENSTNANTKVDNLKSLKSVILKLQDSSESLERILKNQEEK